MGFFDLNIPYEKSPTTANEASRTKIAVKAMELGYTGIAYNRTISGVISDKQHCSIKPLSISSLLSILPYLSLSAKLHRNLLRIPLSTPFRQYTRVTISVETPLHAKAVCCDNPILKTYDLVAIKPSTQATFDMACQILEVDIITFDFSKGLPFTMKENMVKVAAERGVCFEVDYSSLLSNAKIRSQWIYDAKCLMEWTQGKNIIFSSAAPSVNLLRGPCDVANLLSILGISKERARYAISKNCRNLLIKALRKKRFYKNAIRVQPSSSNTVSNFEDDQQEELLKWDPLSSEGDISLNDWAKCFSSLSSKASEIAPVVDSMPSHGFQTKDFLPSSNASPVIPNGEKISQSTPVFNNSTEDTVIQNGNNKQQKYQQDPKCDDEHNGEDLETAQHTVSKTDISISKDLLVAEQPGKLETEAFELAEMEILEDGSAVETHTEDQKLSRLSTESDQVSPVESVSGRSRVKRRRPRAPPLFPLKLLFNQMLFKRKGKKRKSKTKQE